MQDHLGYISAGFQANLVQSEESEETGWAIGDPSTGVLTNRTPESRSVQEIPLQQEQEQPGKSVTFEAQHTFAAAAAARGGHRNSASRQLDLLPKTTENVTGELAWSNVPLTTTYKRLPLDAPIPMDPAQTVELAELPRELSDILVSASFTCATQWQLLTRA